jgi:RNA polymerase sigma-54 factor
MPCRRPANNPRAPCRSRISATTARPTGSAGRAAPPSRDDRNDDEPSYAEIQAAATSLRDHLGAQLAMMPLSERDRSLVRLLIEALDDDGYLAQSLEELVEMLPPELEVDLDELQIALKHLQNFDPPGIGARSAAECLALQLANLPQSKTRDLALKPSSATTSTSSPRATTCAAQGGRLQRGRAARGAGADPLSQPAPRRAVLPGRDALRGADVVVRKVRGQWTASLNGEAMPRCASTASTRTSCRASAARGLASQLQEAKWLIKNVQQRFDTIQRVSQAIVDRQRQFFEHGEVAMRPLVLREIADQLGLHESTISRVTTQKYMATPRGVFELKYFFGSHVATDTGGAASSTAIRALIKQLVGAEDGKKPLSDASSPKSSASRASWWRGAPSPSTARPEHPAGQPAR